MRVCEKERERYRERVVCLALLLLSSSRCSKKKKKKNEEVRSTQTQFSTSTRVVKAFAAFLKKSLKNETKVKFQFAFFRLLLFFLSFVR